MTKICFFIDNLNQPGGTERVTSVIANELQNYGYNIHMLSLQCGESPFYGLTNGIIINQLFSSPGCRKLRIPITVIKLRNYLQKHQIDILIDVDCMLALYSLPAITGLNIRHICWEHFFYHNDLGKASRSLARKLAARFADDVVTLTERDKILWMENTICKANIIPIANPITIDIPDKVSFERENVFLAVGRLTHIKGFDLLLEAWSRISPFHTDWRLQIIGDGEDKIMLEDLCKHLNIDGSVEFIASTNVIERYYQQATFLVMSSRFEGLPLVQIEAQAYGIPIISFNCDTGPSEIIINNKTGWLCPPGDIDSLSVGMGHAIHLAKNHKELLKVQLSSVENSKRFSLKEITKHWVKLLSQ